MIVSNLARVQLPIFLPIQLDNLRLFLCHKICSVVSHVRFKTTNTENLISSVLLFSITKFFSVSIYIYIYTGVGSLNKKKILNDRIYNDKDHRIPFFYIYILARYNDLARIYVSLRYRFMQYRESTQHKTKISH